MGGAAVPIRTVDSGSAPVYNNACRQARRYVHGSHLHGVFLLLLSIMVPSAALLLPLLWAFGLSFSATVPDWFSNISTNLFNLSGDVMLGGLFPINHLTSNLTQRTVPDNVSCDR